MHGHPTRSACAPPPQVAPSHAPPSCQLARGSRLHVNAHLLRLQRDAVRKQSTAASMHGQPPRHPANPPPCRTGSSRSLAMAAPAPPASAAPACTRHRGQRLWSMPPRPPPAGGTAAGSCVSRMQRQAGRMRSSLARWFQATPASRRRALSIYSMLSHRDSLPQSPTHPPTHPPPAARPGPQASPPGRQSAGTRSAARPAAVGRDEAGAGGC